MRTRASQVCREKTDCRSVFPQTASRGLARRLAVQALAPALALACLLTSGPTLAAGLGETDAVRSFCKQQSEHGLVVARAGFGDALVAEREVLPNPTLSGNYQHVLGGIEEQEVTVGVSVPLGISGQRFGLQDAAAAWRKQTRLAAGADRMGAAIAFRRAFVMAALDRARLAVRKQKLVGYRALLDKLNALASAGESASHDRLRLQTEAELLTVTLAPLEARVAAQKAWLQAMVGANVSLDAPPEALATAGPAADSGVHPRVASLRAAAHARSLDAKASRRASVPDLQLFGGYRMLSGGSDTGHGFALGLSLPLTFFDHGQGAARRADAQQAIAMARAQRIERDNRAQREAAAARERALRDSATRLDQAIANATKVRRDAERLYLAAEGSLLAVLSAHSRLNALQLARVEIAAAAASARLDAMEARGRLDDATLSAACGEPRR
jgi:outer membrane protein TolC